MLNYYNYIGTASEYPLQVKNGSGRVIVGPEVIEKSITQILGIEIGTNVANPYFGSNLVRILFEQADEVAVSLGRTYIIEALKEWERRIEVTNVQGQVKKSNVAASAGTAAQRNSLVEFTIGYRILATNEPGSFVYPFYRQLNW